MTYPIDFFGAAPVLPSSSPARFVVAPAAVRAGVGALGEALPAGVYLGTSSWAFPGWTGIVYERAASESLLSREGLAAYSRHPVLRAVGLDRTYHAAIPAREFARYAAQVPTAFRFVVKAPAVVTDAWLRAEGGKPHAANERFLDAAFATAHFVQPALEGLGARCGALVFQLPPLGRDAVRKPVQTIGRLRAFLAALPRGPVYGVELRDAALVGPGLAAALGDAGARYCFGVHARMPSVAEQAQLMAGLPPGPLVARWNLHAGFAYEEAKAHYAPFDRLVDEDPVTREALADLTAKAIADGQPVFIIANNKAEGSAPLTLVKLAEAIVARAGAR
jgi:uncharacterized protein YecE (DUF72 family)